MENKYLEDDTYTACQPCQTCGEEQEQVTCQICDDEDHCTSCTVRCDICGKKVCRRCIKRYWLNTGDDVCVECIANGKALKYAIHFEKRFAEPESVRLYLANQCEDLLERIQKYENA